MSPNGITLAIGHPSTHWFANVSLMETDHEMAWWFPDVKHIRYMDDIALVSNNKRHIRQAMRWLIEKVLSLGMKIKRTWQISQIKARGLTYLSYRFFKGYTVLAKRLLYRITRKVKRAAANLTAHNAAGILSYVGILKHCDSFNIRDKYVYPFISIKKCKEVVSNASKNNVWSVARHSGGLEER